MSAQNTHVICKIDHSPLNRGLSGAEWIARAGNYFFMFRNGDFMLFEDTGDRIYEIHYMFDAARGTQAIVQAKLAFHDAFTKRNARAIVGHVPVENRKARMFSRLVGGTSLGIIETVDGPCEKFVLSLDKWKAI